MVSIGKGGNGENLVKVSIGGEGDRAEVMLCEGGGDEDCPKYPVLVFGEPDEDDERIVSDRAEILLTPEVAVAIASAIGDYAKDGGLLWRAAFAARWREARAKEGDKEKCDCPDCKRRRGEITRDRITDISGILRLLAELEKGGGERGEALRTTETKEKYDA